MPRVSGLLILALSSISIHAEGADPEIFTFPIGLVAGEQTIEVDLGSSGETAELYLDEELVCRPSVAQPSCLVNLGEAPRIHLLELIRRNPSGSEVARDERWINRPGQEAEVTIQLAHRSPQGVCRGRLILSHPQKQHPVILDVAHNGRRLRLSDDGRSFAFPCPDPDEPNMMVASAVFPDGRRAEAVKITGGFGGLTGVEMTAVPLVASDPNRVDCGSVASILGPTAIAIEDAGYEVVFVLDPHAPYRGLLDTPGASTRRSAAWRRSDASLFDAEKIWFVTPNEDLHRIDGFGSSSPKGYMRKGFQSPSGKGDWLNKLFTVGLSPTQGDVRLADAVAASGLVAAAGPRRRAIVLVLGNKAERDDSLFSAEQAQTYLSEIAVPLLVIRPGRVRNDGWPTGVRTPDLHSFATTLEALKSQLDGQCIVWFQGYRNLSEIVDDLPPGVAIAGQIGEPDQASETGGGKTEETKAPER